MIMTKIVFWLVLIVGIIGFVIFKFHPKVLGLQKFQLPTQSVQGVSTFMSPQVQATFGLLQSQISRLSPKDISTSSPQVQAILKTLQALPQGEARDVCQKLCASYVK